MTAAGSQRPKGSDWTAGLGSCVGQPLTTRSPGYCLPPHPSFILIPLGKIDGAVRRYTRQTKDNCEQRALLETSKTDKLQVESPSTRCSPRYER